MTRFRLFIFIFLALSLTGCASGAGTYKVPPIENKYTLGIGDKIHVIVFDQDNLTGDYMVEPNGKISLPLVNEVDAAGFTTDELEAAIADKLSPEYLVNPQVSIEVTNYRSIFVLGEVQQPGKYEYAPNMTVLQAVAVAGGYTYRADEDGGEVTRHVKEGLSVFDVDEKAMLKPGDTIMIKRRWF